MRRLVSSLTVALFALGMSFEATAINEPLTIAKSDFSITVSGGQSDYRFAQPDEYRSYGEVLLVNRKIQFSVDPVAWSDGENVLRLGAGADVWSTGLAEAKMGVGFSVAATYEVGPISFIGRGGVVVWDQPPMGDASIFEPMIGFGIGYRLTQNISTVAEWQHMVELESRYTHSPTNRTTLADRMTIGIRYTF